MSRFAISFIVFTSAAACHLSTDDPAPDANTDAVADLVCGVRSETAIGTYQSGSPPRAGDGPTAMVTSPGLVIRGGTVSATVAGSESFNSAVIAVAGAEGYYVVALPSAVSSVDLQLTLCQAIDRPSIALQYAIGTATRLGAYQDASASLVAVGTGEVQVSVSWDTDSDVDLHVIDPNGNEVFYGQPSSPSGGMLDLDSNAGCEIDHVKIENITWATAPHGTYTVRLDYFQSCDVADSNYIVTVQRKGHPAETFAGRFIGDGDLGDLGAGTDITTFTSP